MSDSFAKRIKDDIARFVADPTRDGLRNLIQYFGGEFDQYELKEAWPVLPRIAKSVLAIANSGGGVILFGINDASLDPVGLSEFMPKQHVFDVLGEFLPGPLLNDVTMLDFDYDEAEYPELKDKLIQVLAIPDLPHLLPFVCENEWTQDDAHLRRGAIYVRNGTQTIESSYEQIQLLINRHVDTVLPGGNVDELTQELAQLHALYVAQQRASHPDFWGSRNEGATEVYQPDLQLAEYLGSLITLQQVAIAERFGL